ncbi:MAG: 16S rRNA (adenine(1518)-N(6)/adenine(1519)-N(6))-dimethyltransferase RsmA [Gammaproteobacteria bacterium]
MIHKARKRFGQNFLTDTGVIADILSHLQIERGQHWVEIGPGLGALTVPLLDHPIRLDIVELDRDLAAHLQKLYGDKEHLTLHNADALTFDFSALAEDGERLRIVGNLPYNISTPLLFHLMKHAACIDDMYFMLQKEVVDRICAAPGGKNYGRLTIMLQYFCAAEALFEVPPESFDPAPKVTSAVVKLLPHRHPPVAINNIGDLNRVVTQAFSQRRKTIRNALKKLVPEQHIDALGIDPASRPECLTLDDFARLSNALEHDAV